MKNSVKHEKKPQITEIKNVKYFKKFHYPAKVKLGHSIVRTCGSRCAPVADSPAVIVGTRPIMEWSCLLSWWAVAQRTLALPQSN